MLNYYFLQPFMNMTRTQVVLVFLNAQSDHVFGLLEDRHRFVNSAVLEFYVVYAKQTITRLQCTCSVLTHTPYRTHVQNGKYSIFTALAVNSGVKLHEGHIKCCFMVNLPVSDASSLYLRDDQRPAWLLAGCDVIKFHSVNIEIVLWIGWCVLLSNRATSWSLLTTDSNAHLYPTPLWQLHVKRTTARDYRF